MKLQERFAANLKRIRDSMGWTQDNMARIVGVTWNTLARWERCEVSPSLETIDRVAAALGVDVMELLEASDGNR